MRPTPAQWNAMREQTQRLAKAAQEAMRPMTDPDSPTSAQGRWEYRTEWERSFSTGDSYESHRFQREGNNRDYMGMSETEDYLNALEQRLEQAEFNVQEETDRGDQLQRMLKEAEARATAAEAKVTAVQRVLWEHGDCDDECPLSPIYDALAKSAQEGSDG